MSKEYKNAEQLYDDIADIYDEKLMSKEAFDSRLMDEVAGVFNRHGIQEGSILDVACGTGLLATVLGDNFTYSGIDISGNMLKKSKERGYNVRQGDALTLLKNEKSGSFDHVMCIGSLYWMSNAMDIWKEMVRVARKTTMATLDIVSPIKEQNAAVVYETPRLDHSDLAIEGLTEDYIFYAWTSFMADSKKRIDARMIFLKK